VAAQLVVAALADHVGDVPVRAAVDHHAALQELATAGYTGLTMDGVARRAQTGKAALYRRWASKNDLVLDAVLRVLPDPREIALSESVRDNLLAALTIMTDTLAGRAAFPSIDVMVQVLGEPELRKAFGARVIEPGCASSRQSCARAPHAVRSIPNPPPHSSPGPAPPWSSRRSSSPASPRRGQSSPESSTRSSCPYCANRIDQDRPKTSNRSEQRQRMPHCGNVRIRRSVCTCPVRSADPLPPGLRPRCPAEESASFGVTEKAPLVTSIGVFMVAGWRRSG
jgi:hypothetical protein